MSTTNPKRFNKTPVRSRTSTQTRAQLCVEKLEDRVVLSTWSEVDWGPVPSAAPDGTAGVIENAGPVEGISRGGTVFAEAEGTQTVIRDFATGRVVQRFPFGGSVRSVAFNKTGDRLVSGLYSPGKATLQDISTGAVLRTIDAGGNLVTETVFSTVEDTWAVGIYGVGIHITTAGGTEFLIPKESASGDLGSPVFSDDGKELVFNVSSSPPKVQIFALGTQTVTQTLQGDGQPLYYVGVHGQTVVAGGGAPRAIVWDRHSGTQSTILRVAAEVYSVSALSEEIVAVGDRNGTLAIFDVRAPETPLWSVTFPGIVTEIVPWGDAGLLVAAYSIPAARSFTYAWTLPGAVQDILSAEEQQKAAAVDAVLAETSANNGVIDELLDREPSVADSLVPDGSTVEDSAVAAHSSIHFWELPVEFVTNGNTFDVTDVEFTLQTAQGVTLPVTAAGVAVVESWVGVQFPQIETIVSVHVDNQNVPSLNLILYDQAGRELSRVPVPLGAWTFSDEVSGVATIGLGYGVYTPGATFVLEQITVKGTDSTAEAPLPTDTATAATTTYAGPVQVSNSAATFETSLNTRVEYGGDTFVVTGTDMEYARLTFAEPAIITGVELDVWQPLWLVVYGRQNGEQVVLYDAAATTSGVALWPVPQGVTVDRIQWGPGRNGAVLSVERGDGTVVTIEGVEEKQRPWQTLTQEQLNFYRPRVPELVEELVRQCAVQRECGWSDELGPLPTVQRMSEIAALLRALGTETVYQDFALRTLLRRLNVSLPRGEEYTVEQGLEQVALGNTGYLFLSREEANAFLQSLQREQDLREFNAANQRLMRGINEIDPALRARIFPARSQPQGLSTDEIRLLQADPAGLPGTLTQVLQQFGSTIDGPDAEQVLGEHGYSYLVGTLHALRSQAVDAVIASDGFVVPSTNVEGVADGALPTSSPGGRIMLLRIARLERRGATPEEIARNAEALRGILDADDTLYIIDPGTLAASQQLLDDGSQVAGSGTAVLVGGDGQEVVVQGTAGDDALLGGFNLLQPTEVADANAPVGPGDVFIVIGSGVAGQPEILTGPITSNHILRALTVIESVLDKLVDIVMGPNTDVSVNVCNSVEATGIAEGSKCAGTDGSSVEITRGLITVGRSSDPDGKTRNYVCIGVGDAIGLGGVVAGSVRGCRDQDGNVFLVRTIGAGLGVGEANATGEMTFGTPVPDAGE